MHFRCLLAHQVDTLTEIGIFLLQFKILLLHQVYSTCVVELFLSIYFILQRKII